MAGTPVAANSSITGTTPVVADGVSTSTVSIELRDFYNNPVEGQLPTFSATDTDGGNIYGACGLSDALGISICTLKSTKAEVKTLSIVTPFIKAGSTVTFTSAPASVTNSTIAASGPVLADGVATSTVTITLKDGSNNPVVGTTPTFSATNTGSSNVYGACSATDASGISTCTLTSTKAELKALSITSPITKVGGNVIFDAGPAVVANTTITGTTPVVADGVATSTITISLQDAFNNPVPGTTPTFSATDTGTTNVYGTCSASNTTGNSTCTLSSLTAESKTLNLLTPVTKSGGPVIFIAGAADAANSSITGTSPVVADGVATSTVTVTLKDASNNPVVGTVPTFGATDTNTTNVYGTCSSTDNSGVSTCILTSQYAEVKTLSIATPVAKSGGTVTFTAGGAVAANSSITGSGPVIADGVATSTVTITLKDIMNNPVVGTVPTFGATDGGTTNVYGGCSSTDVSGVSTCTLKSTKAELKTLSIVTPVAKAGGTTSFIAGSVSTTTTTISGTTPVTADGVASSTITITVLDAYSNPIAGQTPTFSATDTGTDNAYGSCGSTNASGISTCTLRSLTAETKTLNLLTPVIKTGTTVVFTAGIPVAANSTITGTSPVVADGVATSTITVTLKDINNNPVAGQTPTISATDTGGSNVYEACSATSALGISTCALKSTKAEVKTLSIVTPVAKSDGTVTYTAGVASAANSTITGTGPVVADGTATSTVTITLQDASGNPIVGTVPTFSATDTSSTNVYGTCSATNGSGITTCTLSSQNAEIKTLAIVSPVAKSGGTVIFTAGSAVAANSTITGTGPILANGLATSSVTINLRDANNNPVAGQTPTFSATDSGSNNVYGSCSVTNATGISNCTLASSTPEMKTLSITSPVTKVDGTVSFIAGTPVAANSTITGTGPVIADGIASSTVTITLKDASNLAVPGIVPTFDATDSGIKNTYGTCSLSNASGVSICTLKSLRAEIKTLSILTPVAKTGGTVTFTSAGAVAANSSITGTGPVLADGSASSTVTINLQDTNNNPVVGQIPTFSATDTGTTNDYGTCSSTDVNGDSTCILKSTKAEIKTLSITSPFTKIGGTVTFTNGSPVAATSTITGTGPVLANGSATSTVSIAIMDAFSNPVSGVTPTFSATDTGATNVYGACSVTNASGISNCTLASNTAEVKNLSITSPVTKVDGTVTFTAGAAVAANSTITGTTPAVADGVATSTVTITLRDISNNPVIGQTPTFSATDTGSTNVYSTCSVTNASGVSACTLASLKAETKTLSIQTPVVKADGSVVFTPGAPVAANSTITGTSPVVADGTATSTVTITIKDVNNNVISGITPTFSATDTGTTNVYGSCSSTNASGISACTLKSSKAEEKTLTITSPVTKADGTVTFTGGVAVATNSTITGTGPVIANGTATSTVTITLKDISNNPVVGQTPTFSATNTGATNTYGTCSATDSNGISTCTLKSLKAEVKTLSITAPVTKADGTITFVAGTAVATNSTITGTGPVLADGIATSTVTITMLDANNNGVSGITPNFTATNTGTANVYSACSLTDTTGTSTCTLKSTKAETKTLTISSPFTKTGGTVSFIAGSADATKSDIVGTSPVSADGVSVSFITISLNDAFSNPISGVIPIFNATNTLNGNTYGACSATDATGVSTCALASTRAEEKTLQLTSPVAVTGSTTVTFSSLLPTAANSTITGTSPVVADGAAESTVTITLKDANNNAVPGITPTFDATDTGSGNIYDLCSMSDAGGVSVCTFSSTKAETKTLRITNPVLKTGGTVVFTAGTAIATNSSINGTGPVIANGVATSTITIILKDANNNLVTGTVPTFSATNTGSTNVQTACSPTDAAGTSTCTLKSTKAESKTPQILTPVSKSGAAIVFTAGPADATNSTITGTGPVNPDGTSTSTVTITLKDGFSNTISGVVPTFSATGSNNTYGTCSSSTTAGVSTCTLASTTGETKTLSINTPVVKTGGTVLFQSGSAVAANSSITGTGPVIANGVATLTVTITLKDSTNSAVIGIVPTFTASGSNNTPSTCSATNSSGISTCTLTSTKAEDKTLSIASPVIKAGSIITFTPGPASALTSTISATTPTKADGVDTAGVTIMISDAFGNAISGVTPTFNSSGTLNSYGTCSATDATGQSTCTMTSTKAEEKILQLLTPVSVTAAPVDFNPNGINIQVPIELFDRGLASNTTAITFARTRTTLDTSDYVADVNTYMFEIVADNINTSTAYTVSLFDSANIEVAAITVPANTNPMRRFNVIFTPNEGLNNYRVRLPATASASQLKVHSGKIIVEQIAAVATKIYIPLAGSDVTGESNSDTGGSIASTTSTSFTQPTSISFFNIWQRNDAVYDAIPATGNSWSLETVTSTNGTTGTATVALFNKNTGQQITAATTNVTGTTAVTMAQASFPSNAANFTNLNNLEIRMRSSSTSFSNRLFKAGLWIKLKYLRSAEVFFRLANRRSSSSSSTIADSRFFYDDSAWSNPTAYFQTNASNTNSSVVLQSNNTNDFGTTSPLNVSGGSITPTGTYSIQRSSALTLTSSFRYFVRHNRTSGTAVLGGAFMVIRAQE